MSLYCSDGDYGDYESWWVLADGQAPLKTKRNRKCYSCGATINVGDTCQTVFRQRLPNNDIEERIHGDEVQLANKYLCETCSDLGESLTEQGFCFSLGDESIKEQIAQYFGK